MIALSVLSTQFVQVPVSATAAGSPYDPRPDAVAFAFKPPGGGNPSDTDWHAGSWTIAAPGSYLAQCLIGPASNAVALLANTYTIWVKITDSPEIPVASVGLLEIS